MNCAAGFIDLHCHTVFSDGSFEPEAVVAQAAAAGVTTLAITDHDEVGYWPRASAAAAQAGLRLLSGVELSAMHRGREVHILGYGFDPTDERLHEGLTRFKADRRTRALRMVQRLQGLGLEIEPDDLAAPDHNGALGRPHLARHLHETGQVATVQEAFDRYLGVGRPAFQEKNYLAPETACALIRDAGGIPSLAHPKLGGVGDWVGELVERGLGGVEVLHSQHTPEDVARFTAAADAHALVKTGGSDFHGAVKPGVFFGDVRTPETWLEPLETAIAGAQALSGRGA